MPPHLTRRECLLSLAALAGCRAAAPEPDDEEEEDAPLTELDRDYPSRRHVGMNLCSVIDWSNELSLVDVFKASRPWMKDQGEEIETDAHGYPRLKEGQTASTLMVRELEGRYPAGKYVATWEGTGTVEMSRYDVRKVLKETRGRIEADVVPRNGGILFQISASDPKDPIRNVHVWMPGHENAKSPFNPRFTERIAPFGVLRFMDWQKTNDSPLKKWADRPKLADARYSTNRGVPVELMIELANERKAHPWFCIPHLADDEFVREYATLVKERLDPNLRPHVEYSNEVWNWQFDQTDWAKQQGQARRLGDPDHLRFYSQRSVAIFKIWEEVFGGRKRLVRVLSAQFANPWTSEQVLTWNDAHKHADALAVAPYFGHSFGDPKNAGKTLGLTRDQLLDALEAEIDQKNLGLIKQQAEMARKYKVKLFAYEGGQHLVGHGGAENNQALTNLFLAANRDPRMGDLYTKNLTHWFREGGGLFAVFANVTGPGKWGSWGVLEYQDQPVKEAPKYRAVVNFTRGELPVK